MNIENGVIIFDHQIIECKNQKLSSEKIFYVYVLMNPLKEGIWWCQDYIFTYEPFYIGKGKNKRMHYHVKNALNTKDNNHKSNKIRKIIRQGTFPIVGRITEFLNEEEALFVEEYIINELWDYKCLTNKTKQCGGGDNFTYNPDKEKIRLKISEAGIRSYKNPERVLLASKVSSGNKNGMYNKGYLLEGNKNGKYIDVDINIILELYRLGFNCNQIGNFLNVSCSIPKYRLKKLNIIKKIGRHSSKKHFLYKNNLITLYKQGEINYEELKQQCKNFNSKALSFMRKYSY
jgi:hypothetical protein